MPAIPLPKELRFPFSFGLCLLGGAAPTLVTDLWNGPPTRAVFVQPADDAPAAQPAPAPYARVVEAPDAGGQLTLELAARRMEAPDGPAVVLAAAVHIADEGFYTRMQSLLDACDAVLFEGVKPPGAGEIEVGTDEERAAATRRRLRFLAMAVEVHRTERGSLPLSLAELASLPRTRLAAGCLDDAWGRAVLFTTAPSPAGNDAFDLLSLGADGAEGGEGPAADQRFSAQDPLSDAERGGGSGAGIQPQLAAALGLVFQKDAIDTAGPNWRHSDLSLDELMRRLEAAGASGEALFRMLDGSSLTARFTGLLLRFIGASPTMRAATKVMLVEVLANADEVFDAAPGMGGLMSVILHDRNEAVLADLRRIAAAEPALRTVAVFYGAGHLPDMERRLAAEMGYRPAGDEWVPAISVSLREAGLSPERAAAMRELMRRSIRQQVERVGQPGR